MPDMSRFFDGFVERSDNILASIEFSKFVHPLLQILTQSQACDSHVTSVYKLIFEQEVKDL